MCLLGLLSIDAVHAACVQFQNRAGGGATVYIWRMTFTDDRARSLLALSVGADDAIREVAIARFPRSVALTLLLVLGLPCALIGGLVAVREWGGTGAVVAGAVGALAVLASAIAWWRRGNRTCVVGLSAQQLIVAVLGAGDEARISSIHRYPLAGLRDGHVASRWVNTGGPGVVRFETLRLRIADPQDPLTLEFPAALMSENVRVARAIVEVIEPVRVRQGDSAVELDPLL